MGSATAQAAATATAALQAAPGVDLAVAGDLFAAVRALADSPQLTGALADWGAAEASRRALAAAVFAPLGDTARALVQTVAAQRWSSPTDLIDTVERLAVRAAASTTDGDVEGELFGFTRVVAGNADLELALGSRLGDQSAKGALVRSLLAGRAGDAATLIASSLVERLRGRRVRSVLAAAQRTVATARDRRVATVTSAVPLSDAQVGRLTRLLGTKYGTDVAVNGIVDPSMVGGLRVQIGDDVIDASVSSRLADLRARLAG